MSTVTTLVPITRARNRVIAREPELRLLRAPESPNPIAARPARESRPVSLLAEAERRLKACMQATASLLRLDGEMGPDAATESALSEMEGRVQELAALEKTRCRAGDFDRVDLAVYLRHAAALWNSPPRTPLPGGWTCDDFGASVEWRLGRPDRTSDVAPLGALNVLVRTLPANSQEGVRLAAFAAAVLFPPWRVRWCTAPPSCGSSQPPAQAAGAISVRIQTTDTGVFAQLRLSDRGPGLPGAFVSSAQSDLARDLEGVLRRLTQLPDVDRVVGQVGFDVAFVPSL